MTTSPSNDDFNPQLSALDGAPHPSTDHPVRAIERFRFTCCKGLQAGMSTPEPANEIHAQLLSDRAAYHRDQAIEQARAALYQLGTAEMAHLDVADHHYQRARRHLEALWDAATAATKTETC